MSNDGGFKQYFSSGLKPEDVTSGRFYLEPPSGVCKATKLYLLPLVHHLCVQSTFKLLSHHLGTEKINGTAKWKSAHDNGGRYKSAREGGDTSTDKGDHLIKKGSNICTYPACIYEPVPVSYPQRPGGGASLHLHGVVTVVTIRKGSYQGHLFIEEEKERNWTELNIPVCVFMGVDVRPKLISN